MQPVSEERGTGEALGIGRQVREPKLVDPFGRQMRKLRLSLLDACNLRCLYCMPENPRFMPASKRLQAKELVRIASVLVEEGIEEIRLTGGEPTLHPGLLDVATGLSGRGLGKLGLTSNGVHLERLLPALAETECEHLNISLDSLDRERYARLARRDGLKATLSSIEKAVSLGFQVKVNTVVMRGLNDDEVENFVVWASKMGVEVRFLELMAIGVMQHEQRERLVTAAETLERLKAGGLGEIRPVVTEWDSTSEKYESAIGARFGLIAPVTRSFCHSCSRWRLTAEGKLQACLMSEAGVPLGGASEDDIRDAARRVLLMKPRQGAAVVATPMHQIGG